jgi:GxxExxY protein
MMELRAAGLDARAHVAISINYKGSAVGVFVADIVVEGRVVLELKAKRNLSKEAEAQLINYLRASGMRGGLLINFTFPKASIARFVA